jgi:hypothetical protein
MQQQLHSPPGIMLQRFCSIVADALSSHAQTTFMPPGHFLNVIVQRGTITTFMPGAGVAGAPITPLVLDKGMLGIPNPTRSIMIADVMPISFSSRVVLSLTAARAGAVHHDNSLPGFQVIPPQTNSVTRHPVWTFSH